MDSLYEKNLLARLDLSSFNGENLEGQLNAKIVYGEINNEIFSAVKQLAPIGVTCFISTIETFLSRGKAALAVLEKFSSPLSVVIKKKFDGAIENAGGLLNLSEDIRSVVLLDNELLDVALYFSAKRNIPLIYAPITADIGGIFDKSVKVKVKNTYLTQNIENYRHIIIDEEVIAKSSKSVISATYADIVSRVTALIDYRLRCIFGKVSINEKAYNLARDIIKNTVEIKSFEETPMILAENSLKLSVASALSGGELFGYSAEKFLGKLLALECEQSIYECRLFSAYKLIELYKLFFTSDFKALLKQPDYCYRAEKLSEITEISEKEILESFNENSFSTKFIEKKLKPVRAEFIEECNGLSALADEIIEKYIILGGNADIKESFSTKNLYKAVFSAPDFPNEMNALTLIRDVGILEYLK